MLSQLKYRPDIDGLRALAVVPVILFHAGFKTFSGGFVGVDIFFVISGYLITTIILSELQRGSFSIANFYERRARRILPALFFVLLCCFPFAWLWLLPQDMKDFSKSLVAVCLFFSNVFFWRSSGYFDTANELKPLLHTWSLSVEEQFYVFFPLYLMVVWRFGKKIVGASVGIIAVISLILAQYLSSEKPMAAFYLLPTRAWELMVGALAAFYILDRGEKEHKLIYSQIGSLVGFLLIWYSILNYDKQTPFPGFYTLAPTIGAVLIIIFSSRRAVIGKLLANKVLVGIGLISYSAYLWHQPLFAFTRHKLLHGPSMAVMACLVLASFFLAWVTWLFVERPFRSRGIPRKTIFVAAPAMILVVTGIGLSGYWSGGFSSRFPIQGIPQPWSGIKCHGAGKVRQYQFPLDECLGKRSNGEGGDFFLVGDSHAAQFTFPLSKLAHDRGREFGFINLENAADFPFSFWRPGDVSNDRVINHLLKVADKGDFFIVSFHRGYLNDSRDSQIPLDEPVDDNSKKTAFYRNSTAALGKLVAKGVIVYLVKDSPLLPDTTSIEKCALYKTVSNNDFCSVALAQDLHTRKRQSDVFDQLAKDYEGSVFALDVLPILYAGQTAFSPIYDDGSYCMFDRHHLTEKCAHSLLPYFSSAIR